MPTNSNYDGYFSGIGGVPIFTYGMITITAVVLSYMTYMDTYIPDETTESIKEATSIDGVIDSNAADTTGAIPEETIEGQQSPFQDGTENEELPIQGEAQGEAQGESQEAFGSEPPAFQEQPESEPPLFQQEQPESEPFPNTDQTSFQDSSEEIRQGGKKKRRTTRRSKPSGKKY